MTNMCERRLSNAAGVILLTVAIILQEHVIASRIYYHPGETQPVTVEAAIGADFNITCYMNPMAFLGENSSSLYFVNGRTNAALPQENIVIMNSTTIVYMVRNASEQQTEYRCKSGSAAIMETKVFVGTPPRPGTNFTCRSYDFDYMICNFTKPPNPILTTYNVSYYNDMPNYIFQPHCNYDDRALVVCNTSLKDRYQEIYNFIIESSNALVKPNEQPLTQTFVVNNFEIMIPAKPGENMRLDSVTVDTVRMTFQMHNWEKYRAKGLQWEVLVRPENATVLVYEAPVREHNELRLRLNNLPYAHWRYELMLRVRVKHPNAVWSEQFMFKFRTAARRPARPPQVQPGSFYIDSMETSVTIYWEELQRYEYNGDNFTYAIKSVRRDGQLVDLKPLQMEINLVIFPWHKHSQYEFELCSRNHMGDSLKSSRLTIYPFSRTFPKNYMPKDINNVYHANNRSYTLTWSKPRHTIGLQDYTVFWCYPKRALPNECRESMHFQQVPATQLNFTTEKQNASEEHTLNLAVAANYESFNTGLHWTDCTMDVNGDLVKMDPELMDLMPGTTSIKVHWNVERVCTSILEGFNLTYCEVGDNVASDNATCLHRPRTIFQSKYEKKYNITGLKPFTMYKFSMYMFSRIKKGKSSDPQLIRTLEGAPSPPRQLKVSDITNNSAHLMWSEPSHPNGKIRKYIIMLNNDKTEVNATTLEYHLTDLESFTSYKVYVMAQTVDISETSNDVHFTTAIGYPSPPGQAPRSNNASVVQWSKPSRPHGRIEFYEVAVTQKRREDVIRRRISIIMEGETSCSFSKIPPCLGTEYQTTVEVRAVNAASLTHETANIINGPYEHDDDISYNYNNDDNDDLICDGSGRRSRHNNEELQRYLDKKKYRLYKSAWQTSTIYSCSTSRMSKITTIALGVVAMSLGVMAALYMARKKYNKMANINCTLPAGLETYFTKDNNGFPSDFTGNAATKSFDSATRTAEDQWITAARMHEFNFRNEHHHLLASLGNDSGYLGGGGVERNENLEGINTKDVLDSKNVGNESSKTLDNDIDNDHDDNVLEEPIVMSNKNCSSSSVDSLVDSTEESDTPMSDAEQDSLAMFPPTNGGYVKQSMLQPWQSYQEENIPSLQPATNNTGYITVQNLDLAMKQAEIKPSSSGYVMQQDLQNFFKNSVAQQQNPTTNLPETLSSPNATVADGYTTLDDLCKLKPNNMPSGMRYEQTQPVNNAPILERNSNLSDSLNDIQRKAQNIGVGGAAATSNCISGYVTQQDLNLFGQHQQH